jgi:hypothetical protein
LAEEMRRKAEQGSITVAGEVTKLLEELLRTAFPFDVISRWVKELGWCIQTVRNNSGQECGRLFMK